MHRIDGPGATGLNRFTEGNPATGTPATTVTADWLNAVQEELVELLAALGGSPDKQQNDQIASALLAVLDDASEPATQAEAEAGTETALRRWSPLRVAQAIASLAPQPDAATQAEAEAGTEEEIRAWSPLRIAQAILALGGWKYSGAIATTSGTAVDIEDIPPEAQEIVLMLQGARVSVGEAVLSVTLGTGSGFETSNYWGSSNLIGSQLQHHSHSGNFRIGIAGNAADTHHGCVRLNREGAGHEWGVHISTATTAGRIYVGAGRKSLGAALSRLRVATNSGTFNAGAIKLAWR